MIIAGRKIDRYRSPYVIAEIGAAHNGLLDRALTLMERAKRAGADAVKIQCFAPETITFDGAGDEFVIRSGPWAGKNLWDLYSKCAMPREWYGALFDRAKVLDIPLLASVFSREDIRWMEEFGCEAYKLASFELVDLDLIEALAETGKPVIMSTGMARVGDVSSAVGAYFSARGSWGNLALLHCTSAYPTPPEAANLRSGIANLRNTAYTLGADAVHVGFSDHTLGIEAPIAATVLGAEIIEKHITVSRSDGGEDDHFAATPDEFADMVAAVKRTWKMIESSGTAAQTAEDAHADLRRSLYAVKDIWPGERFTRDNVRSIRPGAGLHPKHLPTVLACVSKVAVKAGTPMSLEFVERV